MLYVFFWVVSFGVPFAFFGVSAYFAHGDKTGGMAVGCYIVSVVLAILAFLGFGNHLQPWNLVAITLIVPATTAGIAFGRSLDRSSVA